MEASRTSSYQITKGNGLCSASTSSKQSPLSRGRRLLRRFTPHNDGESERVARRKRGAGNLGGPLRNPNPDQPKTPNKPGKEKMAMVTATLSVDPYDRPPVEETVEGLLCRGQKTRRSRKTRRPRPAYKRIVASQARQVNRSGQGSAGCYEQNPRQYRAQVGGCPWREEPLEFC
jgi:hypothetical protein